MIPVGSTTGKASLSGVWGSASNDVYAVGHINDTTSTQPVILHFDGTVWKSVKGLPASGALNAIYGVAANDIYVVGSEAILLHFDGKKWSSIKTGETGDFESVWASGPADICVGRSGSQGSGLLHFDGSQWKLVPLPGGAAPSVIQAFGGTKGAIRASDHAGDLLRFD